MRNIILIVLYTIRRYCQEVLVGILYDVSACLLERTIISIITNSAIFHKWGMSEIPPGFSCTPCLRREGLIFGPPSFIAVRASHQNQKRKQQQFHHHIVRRFEPNPAAPPLSTETTTKLV